MYFPRALVGLLSLTIIVTDCKPPPVEPSLPEISIGDYLQGVASQLRCKPSKVFLRQGESSFEEDLAEGKYRESIGKI